ncbi:mediator complex subunit Med5-domain-containing protein [Pilobolus umbonatus]|nr:mediator complex subunit Med5-domain-containing protein [Pilobolus umbonatus]
MSSLNKLEIVLQYAYTHKLSSEQWMETTEECMKAGDTADELCDLLLTTFFSITRLSDPLLEEYITHVTTGANKLTDTPHTPLISPLLFLQHLIQLGKFTTSRHPHQWNYLLKLLPFLLTSFDSQQSIHHIQQGQTDEWVDTVTELIKILARLIATGLYPDHYAKVAHTASPVLAPSLSFYGNTQHGFDSQFSFQSQHSMPQYDLEATWDSTQQADDFDLQPGESRSQPSIIDSLADLERKKGKYTIEVANAALAAHIIIHFIENMNIKKIFEVRNNQRKQAGIETEENEPWLSCQSMLSPHDPFIKATLSTTTSQNPLIQKVLLLIQKLTDRDHERRMAVHMKYHELEDEGTARGMPSAGLMGLLYHMVQIRPCLDDDYIVDHLIKLQTIKGSFDESFYLELWIVALTGLREASLNTSCQGSPDEENTQDEDKEKGCNPTVALNRLLWKCLVLVKLPYLIGKLQERKDNYHQKSMESEENELNAVESSLQELKAFTGLLNACSPAGCCSEFHVPESMTSALVEKITYDDGEDDFMSMMNDMQPIVELNSTVIIKAIRSSSNNEIFTNIVKVCERYGFIRPVIAATLLKKENDTQMESDELDERSTAVSLIDQNISQRLEAIEDNVVFTSLSELIQIGLMSHIHLKRIMDFLIDLLKKKASLNDFYAVSNICDSLIECPCSIDLILQLYSTSDVLQPLENMCNQWHPSSYEVDMMDGLDSGRNEDEDELEGVQLLYNKFSKLWDFIVYIVHKYKLNQDISAVFMDTDGFLYNYFSRGPLIYHTDDDGTDLEPLINNWLNALVGGEGLSDSLLRTSSPQEILLIIPTVIQRAMLFYGNGQIDNDAFNDMLTYLQKPFLNFTLPTVIPFLCEELLSGQPTVALTCLCQIIMYEPLLPRHINFHSILGSLESVSEMKRQEGAFLTDEMSKKQNREFMEQLTELQSFLFSSNKINRSIDDKMSHAETITTGITPATLFDKTTTMFKYIVKSGRSLFMSDVDADTTSLWKKSATKQQVVSHYLDMVLFQTALSIGGGHWFVNMITEQVLEAGKSGGAVRAAELGSCLIATPLLNRVNQHNDCMNILMCLLLEVLPVTLKKCANQNFSFFQGQTLGVFTSECLVLMQDRHESVNNLGQRFFETLVFDREDNKKRHKTVHEQRTEGTQFATWEENIINSAVWRGFIKGLMSNPIIEEVWPNAFI